MGFNGFCLMWCLSVNNNRPVSWWKLLQGYKNNRVIERYCEMKIISWNNCMEKNGV